MCCKSCPFPLVSKMLHCHVNCHSSRDYSFNQFHLFKATPCPLRDYLKSSPLAPNPSPHCVQSAPADQLAASCLLLSSPVQPNISLGLIFTFTRVNLMSLLELAGLSSRVSYFCAGFHYHRGSIEATMDVLNPRYCSLISPQFVTLLIPDFVFTRFQGVPDPA